MQLVQIFAPAVLLHRSRVCECDRYLNLPLATIPPGGGSFQLYAEHILCFDQVITEVQVEALRTLPKCIAADPHTPKSSLQRPTLSLTNQNSANPHPALFYCRLPVHRARQTDR